MTRAPMPDAAKPLRRDAERNRQLILAAARELFAQRGVDATLDDIAAHAGVGVGTVYRRYPNKDALLDELFEERISELGSLAEAALSDPDAWRALTGFLERAQELFAANRALEYLVVHPVHGRERIALARERLLAPVTSLVERAKADGRLRADFAIADIRIIHTMLAAVYDETHAVSPELWRRYFAMIVDGLASRRSTTTSTAIAAPAQ